MMSIPVSSSSPQKPIGGAESLSLLGAESAQCPKIHLNRQECYILLPEIFQLPMKPDPDQFVHGKIWSTKHYFWAIKMNFQSISHSFIKIT